MDNPDVLKLFHRHSLWMIRISVLVKVNGIRHYSFIDLNLPCFHYCQNFRCVRNCVFAYGLLHAWTPFWNKFHQCFMTATDKSMESVLQS